MNEGLFLFLNVIGTIAVVILIGLKLASCF